MTILSAIFLPLGILIFVVAMCLSFHRLGYRKGQRDGFDAGHLEGRKDADNWWVALEEEADKARRKIWKEEAQL